MSEEVTTFLKPILIILVIVVIILILINFFPQVKEKLTKTSSEILSIQKEVYGTATKEKQREIGISYFTAISENFESCTNTEKSDCICNIQNITNLEDNLLTITNQKNIAELFLIKKTGEIIQAKEFTAKIGLAYYTTDYDLICSFDNFLITQETAAAISKIYKISSGLLCITPSTIQALPQEQSSQETSQINKDASSNILVLHDFTKEEISKYKTRTWSSIFFSSLSSINEQALFSDFINGKQNCI